MLSSVLLRSGRSIKLIKYLVIDCPFNQTNNPDIIGQWFDNPPSYTSVRPVRYQEIFSEDDRKEIEYHSAHMGLMRVIAEAKLNHILNMVLRLR